MKTFTRVLLILLGLCYIVLLAMFVVRPDVFSMSTLRLNTILFYTIMIIRIMEWLIDGFGNGSGDPYKYA